ncbi:hypothetical protein [Aurantimonas sp. VKM B-3413]|uniref:hypothetical protein n=1 Tax=Aurantimonas sp. VKM B-3413 TaxID=2779401 RepID=UPI001E527CC9|nr:hypothetical protein [Aurantimonas sp. VKM B-3413]MCB8836191.1 hypothetical protein [Aurantimonas sp. VKM B-3413]
MTRSSVRLIHEGNLAAEVTVKLKDEAGDWSPAISLADMRRLDRVRMALRRGDVQAETKDRRLFRLTPLAV